MADTAVERTSADSADKSKSYKPQLVSCFQRKLQGPCLDYAQDFGLHAFWHDLLLAKKISSIVALADARRVAAEDIASDMQQFSAFWRRQQAKLEDMCRSQGELPNLFCTVAPAEWNFPLHALVFCRHTLSHSQVLLTRHFYHVFTEGLERLFGNHLSEELTGIRRCSHWTLRFEFQQRGTLHVHALAWITPSVPLETLSARSGDSTASPLFKHLDDLFHGSIDIQAGTGHHCLLRYVAGYISKASDALDPPAVGNTSAWRQVFRLLSKSCPLWQEIGLELAALPLVRQSFTGLTLHAPLPGHVGKGWGAAVHKAYMVRGAADEALCLLQWMRMSVLRVHGGEAEVCSKRDAPAAVGVLFPFELLDTFCGAFLAVFVPHRAPEDLLLEPTLQARLPETTRFFWAATTHVYFEHDASAFLNAVDADFVLRGFTTDRRRTFAALCHAKTLLVQAALRGFIEARCWVPQQRPSMVLTLVSLLHCVSSESVMLLTVLSLRCLPLSLSLGSPCPLLRLHMSGQSNNVRLSLWCSTPCMLSLPITEACSFMAVLEQAKQRCCCLQL